MRAPLDLALVAAAEPGRGARGRARIGAARMLGRALLEEAAALAGAPGLGFPRDDAGAPRTEDGWHWSLANTSGLVVAVVAPFPLGVDAEWLGRPRWRAARDYLERAGDLERLGSRERRAVLALWCAKEAVLKRAGVGLADLGRCGLVSAAAGGMLLEHGGAEVAVRILEHGEHVLALAHDPALALAPRIVVREPAVGFG